MDRASSRRRALVVAAIAFAATTVLPAPHMAMAATVRQPPTEAPSTGLTFDAQPQLGGAYDPGKWIGITVRLGNTGASRTVEVVASTEGGQFSLPVELPTGAEKRVSLLVLPYGSSNTSVRLREAGAQDAGANQRFLFNRGVRLIQSQSQPIAGVLTDSGLDVPGVEGLAMGGPAPIVVKLTPQQLPEEPLAYGSLEVLIVADTDLTVLTPAQGKALHDWVALGGQIAVLGGTLASKALSGLPEDLRPANVTVVEITEEPALQWLAPAKALPPGSVDYARLEPVAGAWSRVAGPDALGPLVVARPVGVGAVSVIAVDPTSSALESWAGLEKVWFALFVPRPKNTWMDQTPDHVMAENALHMIPQLDLPSVNRVIGVIGVYIVLVGPVNFGFLKRRRRLHQAWITIPALTTIAMVVSYIVGARIHGSELIVHQLSTVNVVPEAGLAHVHTFVGIFSPTSRDYTADLSTGFAYDMRSVSPYYGGGDNSLTFEQGASAGVSGLHVDQWSFRSLAVEAIVPWPAEPGGGASNPLGEVRDAHLLAGGRATSLGSLDTETPIETQGLEEAPARTVNIASPDLKDPAAYGFWVRDDLALAALSGRDWQNEMWMDPYENYSSRGGRSEPSTVSLKAPRGATVMGFNDRAPIEVDMRGAAHRTTTLLYAHVAPLFDPMHEETS